MPDLADAQQRLVDAACPLDERLRALYTVKNEGGKTIEQARILIAAVDTTDSVLLQHELLYNLGQFQLTDEVVPFLKHILSARKAVVADGNASDSLAANFHYNVVSRHEAIESLGAILCRASGVDQAMVEDLRATLVGLADATKEPFVEIRESAMLALMRMDTPIVAAPKDKDAINSGDAGYVPPSGVKSAVHPFVSVDPSPPFAPEGDDAVLKAYQNPANKDMLAQRIEALKTALDTGVVADGDAECAMTSKAAEVAKAVGFYDTQVSLWNRYRAMFSLRNINTAESVLAICDALQKDTTSALFRHELAFLLGQLEHPVSGKVLNEVIANVNEHPMVRHEAAEAVGAIAEDEGLAVLEKFSSDSEKIVVDSCVVALEMHKYWSRFKSTSSE